MNLATSKYVNVVLNGHDWKRYEQLGISKGLVGVLQRRQMQAAFVIVEDFVKSNMTSKEVAEE